MANADQLRREIDRGQGSGKVAYPDPAAAPLATDDEAAGRPPAQAEIEQARHDEIDVDDGPGPNTSDETTRSPSGEGLGLPPPGVTPLLLCALALVLVVAGLIFAYLYQP